MQNLTSGKRLAPTAAVLGLVAVATVGVGADVPDDGIGDPVAAANLATFDDLDFNVFTGQKWDELHRSHSQDIVVHWPDGRRTDGIDVHIRDLEGMFVYAPDTRIEIHPIRIGSGSWTAVTGVIEGTFTEPMPTADGGSIPPTGKAYRIDMATIGHWNEDGVMDEEWLFWDNHAFLKQLGLLD